MPSFDKPQWFVYIENKKKGPFSYAQIKKYCSLKKITTDTLMWRQGMPQWKKIKDIFPIGKKKRTFFPYGIFLFFLPAFFFLFLETSFFFIEQVFLPYLKKHVDRFSALPLLPGLSKEDQIFLQKIASYKEKNHVGIKISSEKNRFFLVSNAPDGVVFQVRCRGIPQTLLSPAEPEKRFLITIKNKFGSAELSTSVPMGEYEFTVFTDSLEKEGLGQERMVAIESFFLGGKKNATYFSALTEYHALLKKNTQQKVQEYEQIFLVLESQKNATEMQFQQFLKKKQTGVWKKFSSKWCHFHEQLKKHYFSQTEEKVIFSDLKTKSYHAYILISHLHQEATKRVMESKRASFPPTIEVDFALQELNSAILAVQKNTLSTFF